MSWKQQYRVYATADCGAYPEAVGQVLRIGRVTMSPVHRELSTVLQTAQTSKRQAYVRACGLNSEIFSTAAAARLSSSRGDTRNSILASACTDATGRQQCHSKRLKSKT
jgi:hypothetical protein